MRTTLGFMQVGLDKRISANCKSRLRFGLDNQLSALVLKLNFIFSPDSYRVSSGCGQAEY
jgi:hypothetical protein